TRLATVLMTIAIGAWLIKRRRTPAFCLFWLIASISPALLVPDHYIPYYVFLPSIGVAWLAADALVRSVGTIPRAVGWACALFYRLADLPSTVYVRNWSHSQSVDTAKRQVTMERAVREIRLQQPTGPVFLGGVDTEQFWWGLCYGELIRKGYRDIH